MRRVLGYSLASLGFVLIALAPMLRFYVTPRVEKAPLDLYDRIDSTGSGRYFNQAKLEVTGPVPLVNTAIYRGDVKSGTKGVAVYDHFESTRDIQSGELIDISRPEKLAFDRSTGEAVRCCGATRQEGHTLKFPFGTKRQTYLFWDGNLGKAAPAKYVRDDEVEGLKVFVFRQDIAPVVLEPIGIPGSLAGDPSQESVITFINYRAITTLWVEPRTGAILKGEQYASRWLTNGGQFLFLIADTNLGNSAKSVAHTAGRVRSQVGQLQLVRFWVPIIGPLIGLVLLLIGLPLSLRTYRSRPADRPAELSP